MPSSSQIPAIRTFQLDSSSMGDLRSSVNLFRGDVNYTQTLFSMPGRNNDDGMAAAVSLQYQSNVHDPVTTWNRDEPTSVVGAGWNMPASVIELNDNGSPTPGQWTYVYTSNGVPGPLVREPATPLLFTMDGSLAGQLVDGQPVPEAIRTQFTRRGIALNAGATAAKPTAGSTAWTVTDTASQTLYELVPAGAALQARDGGESYQLQSYRFWKFLYYPAFERWSVVNASGQSMSFGGLAAPTSRNYATGIGNSIEWGVRWGTGANALWSGPSTLAAGQKQYARAWRLSRVSNIWGDTLRYGYNEWPRDPSSGLIPGVEQLVGAGGLPYTKACYLTSLTDVFGRRAEFAYAEKVWEQAAESPREYADPHKAVPDTTPNAYQDRYETRYLASIQVDDTDGTRLFGVRLEYRPRPAASGPESAVANVTPYTGSLKGDTFKRYLTGIVMTNADGGEMPGIVFDYHLDPAAAGASPGALKSITQPQGGTASYAYTRQSLAVCERAREITPPAGIAPGATPRVWFGPDYAVTAWYDAAGKLSVVVQTWLGRWEAWQPAPDSALLFSNAGGLEVATLDVAARAEFFALSFKTGSELQVYVFRKAVAQPGQWVPATVGSAATGLNAPTLRYDITSARVTFQGGTNFLVASCMDAVREVYSYDTLTWRWTTNSWTRQTTTLEHYAFVAAAGEYFATLDAGTGAVQVNWLDPTLAWRSSAAATLPGDFPVSDLGSIAMVPGESMVAVSHLNVQNAQVVSYDLFLVQWDQGYTIATPVPSFSFTDPQEPSGRFTTTWIPAVVGNELVAVAGNVLRFNGQGWLGNSSLVSPMPQSGDQQRFAYGVDYVIKIVANGGGVAAPTAQVLSFDPNSDSGGWTRQPAAPAQPLPMPQGNAALANWPSSGQGDWLTLGQDLYFRGTASSWDGVMAAQPLQDLQALVDHSLGGSGYLLDSQSVIDEAPAFLAYAVGNLNDASDNQSAVVVLKNGTVFGAPQNLVHERISTAANAAGPGLFPGGPSMFATFPDTASSFAEAGRFFLHRYAGDAIEGSLVHYAVTGLSIEDGFQDPWPTAYDPDPASAACDPTGRVIKYFRSVVLPGTSDAAHPANGSVENRYLNGLDILTGENFYDMLDGLLYSVSNLDAGGVTLSRTTYDWTAYVARATSPADPASVTPLAGGFVVQTGQTQMQDGVTSAQAISYLPPGLSAPYSGQAVSVVSTDRGGAGTQETFTRTTTYGYDVSDAFVALNLLDAQAQTISTWTPEGGGPVTISASATVYTGWPCALGAGVLVPAPEADFGWRGGGGTAAFPFAGYGGGQTPAGWNPVQRVLARTPLGLVSESADGLGVVTSVLFGDGVFPAATFVNASRSSGQCAYWGFEPYEDTGGFSTSGTRIVTTDAFTGAACLAMPAGGSLSVALAPGAGAATCVVGYWYKTPAGFQPPPDTGWSVAVSVDGTPAAPVTRPFGDTGGEWVYATIGVPLPPGAGTVHVAATASVGQGASGSVLLDAVFAAPLDAQLAARTFDTGYHLVTSTMDASGLVSRTFYDRFQSSVAQVGPGGQTQELSQRFLSRQGNAGGAFDPASPNADLTLHPAGGGVMESFAGPDWTARWDAGASAAQWAAAGGTLVHTGPNAGTLTWRGWPAGAPPTAALFFEAVPRGKAEGTVSVAFGGYTIACTGAGAWSFTGPGGAVVQAPLGTPPALAQQWLLVLGQGAVLFFGDGQLLFSAPVSGVPATGLAIGTGPNTLEVRNLTVVAEPRLGLSYSDAAGRQRQVQQLATAPGAAASDTRITEVIYDALNRKVAVTKGAPGSFGQDAALPRMAYRPHFADVGQFLASTGSSWRMTGDVADYYAGQGDGRVRRSDDQGYPYTGSRYEASPLARVVERGVPGLDTAIHDVANTTPAQRQTVQFSYGTNGADGPLPAGGYTVRTITSPIKSVSTLTSDTVGRQVASAVGGADGDDGSRTAGAVAYASGADGTGCTLTLKLPNAFGSHPQSGQAGYVSRATQDALGRLAARSDPSTALTQYIYDPQGRMRFVQPTLDDGQAQFFYYKYDALGRLAEEGSLAGAWDAARLQTLADTSPAWPGAGDGATVLRAHTYDGDGNDATLIGRKWRMETANPAPATNEAAGPLAVVESFAYDACGRVAAVTAALSGAVSQSSTVGYAYNNLNEVSSITYPEGSPLARLIYTYDDQGRVVGMGSSAAAPLDIAAYTYSADGALETETRNGGTLAGTFQYDSPGWLQAHQVTARGAAKPGFSLGYDYLPNATPRKRSLAFGFGDTPDVTEVSYTYDGQRRLTAASVAGGKPGNESVTTYDANGNIWALEQDGEAFSFSLESGSDRLATADLGGAAASFAFTADGWMSRGRGLALERNAMLGVVTNVTVAGSPAAQVRFGYGGAGLRMLKQAGGAPGAGKVYVYGSAQMPVATVENGVWTAYAYGPNGLAAVVRDRRYFPLVDNLHTVWGLVDDANALAARYDYRPFGGVISASGPASAVLGPMFSGQEYDAETGLYNFRARLYDPVVRRFVSPDPARQFASPYVFVGNDPLTMADPSGSISVWAQVGIGAAMVAVAAVGIGLSLFTGGASGAAAASIDATLATGVAGG
ncbi:RHS repeat-associated core domain-containing protein, partial [Longimicrobium sp.]|uniref:RHS repeat domain-containing protein n=1 Tax=Longimicrobium sp. TaxID=2029185 RepID=UPI002F92F6BB